MSAEFFAYGDPEVFFDFSNPMISVLLVVYSMILLLGVAYGITVYILNALSMYTIAKRRGIHHPWLAWIPVAEMWILGSVSDQYQYVTNGKIRNRRKVLLGLTIATYGLLMVALILVIVSVTSVAMHYQGQPDITMMTSLVGAFGVYMVAWVTSVVTLVFLYMAYYDLFKSCRPDQAVLFLVLGIFFNFLLPFFVLACRKKDEGMPPRRVQIPEPRETVTQENPVEVSSLSEEEPETEPDAEE